MFLGSSGQTHLQSSQKKKQLKVDDVVNKEWLKWMKII